MITRRGTILYAAAAAMILALLLLGAGEAAAATAGAHELGQEELAAVAASAPSFLTALATPTPEAEAVEVGERDLQQKGGAVYYEVVVFVKNFPDCLVKIVQGDSQVYLDIFSDLNPDFATSLPGSDVLAGDDSSNRRNLLEEEGGLFDLEDEDDDDDDEEEVELDEDVREFYYDGEDAVFGSEEEGGADDGEEEAAGSSGLAPIDIFGAMGNDTDGDEGEFLYDEEDRSLRPIRLCPKFCRTRRKPRGFKRCIKLGCAAKGGSRGVNRRATAVRMLASGPAKLSKEQLDRTVAAINREVERRDYCSLVIKNGVWKRKDCGITSDVARTPPPRVVGLVCPE